MSDSTQRLIRDLAGDLAPVHPVPRLRISVARVAGIGAAAVVVGVLALGVNEQLLRDLGRTPVLGGVALSLLALAIGGFVGAAAGSVPGREGSARWGWGIAAFGAALGLVCASWLGAQAFGSADLGPSIAPALSPSSAPSLEHALGCLVCIGIAALLAIPAAAASTVLLARAAPHRSSPLIAAAVLSAASLAGIATLMHCPNMEAAHIMIGHALAPLFGLLFLFLPALFLLRRLSPRFSPPRFSTER